MIARPTRRLRVEMSTNFKFKTQRVPVVGRRGMVASSQPLATEAGMRILQQGGNAADAAVAVTAALCVTEPLSTGIGGDACALFYNRRKKTVECLTGFGRSPQSLTAETVKNKGFDLSSIPKNHGLTVTVPGAGQLWEDALKHWGTQPLKQVLQPAIELCEDGFPVESVTATYWHFTVGMLQGPSSQCFKTDDGRSPAPGQLMYNKDLGRTFRTVAEMGMQKGFYRGRIAEAIVDAVEHIGGVLSLKDLEDHTPSETVEPASVKYRDYTVWEVPPPSQGVVVLAALNHLEELIPEPSKMEWGSADVLHAQIESLRLAFFDVLCSNADPVACEVPLSDMVCKKRAARTRSTHGLGSKASVLKSDVEGKARPDADQSDTVYFCVVDGEGNACSFINSTYTPFGTGMVPHECGFALHNRGYGFTCDPGHPNCLGPSKRPYNTIIPGICTDENGDLCYAFGVMGGFMQPQGHLQVLSNLIDFKMDPQSALDAPRFMIQDIDSFLGPSSVEQSKICLEAGFEASLEELKEKGHEIVYNPYCFFGHGQVIKRDNDGVLWGGTESRCGGIVSSR